MAATIGKQYFDLFGLPAELRNHIYEFAFAPDVPGDQGILALPNGPDHALCLTSRLVYTESRSIFHQAARHHHVCYDQCIQSIGEALRDCNFPECATSITQLHEKRPEIRYARYHRLGVFRNAGFGLLVTEQAQDQLDIVGSYIGIMCNHVCDCTHSCLCERSFPKACYDCRRFYAMAAFFAVSPSQVPRLLDSSGGLTEIGAEAWAWTCTMKGDADFRWEGSALFGRDWWAFEIEKQRMVHERCDLRRRAVQERSLTLSGGAAAEKTGETEAGSSKHEVGGGDAGEISEPDIESELATIEGAFYDKELRCFNAYVHEECFGGLEWESEYRRRAAEAGGQTPATHARWPSMDGANTAFDSMLIHSIWRERYQGGEKNEGGKGIRASTTWRIPV